MQQYAAKGTEFDLIPYYTYFKEWIALKGKRHNIKNAKPIPLQKDAFDYFKRTTVYDENGNFEFTHLKPGEYLLATALGYTHTSKQTEETDRGSLIVNGTRRGNEVYISIFSYSSNPTANIQKVVIIKKKMKE